MLRQMLRSTQYRLLSTEYHCPRCFQQLQKNCDKLRIKRYKATFHAGVDIPNTLYYYQSSFGVRRVTEYGVKKDANSFKQQQKKRPKKNAIGGTGLFPELVNVYTSQYHNFALTIEPRLARN